MKLSLAETQALVLKGIAQHDDQALGLVKLPPNDTAQVMFGVYRNAYILRLTEFLANDHPRLKTYLGDDAFFDMSKAYAAAHPSDNPNARWYSRHLPEFLSQHEPWAAHRDIAELADIERALTDAFDSIDAPIMTVEDLQNVEPGKFEGAVLVIHPSVRRLALKTNAVALWQGLKEDSEPPPSAALPEPVTAIVWRQGVASKIRSLGSEEAMALSSTAEGVPFGVLCEMIAMMGEPDSAALRAATYLRQWIVDEMVSEIRTD
jgi:hypothetical protein